MNDNCAIMGCYTTFKHIKTRKVVVLEIEISEENFQEVITKLGMPIGGESKPVAVALMNKEKVDIGIPISEELEKKTEGEKLRIRAVLLCKNKDFQSYIYHTVGDNNLWRPNEESAKQYMLKTCCIDSRSELVTDKDAAQTFLNIEDSFKDWLFEQQHQHNLKRV